MTRAQKTLLALTVAGALVVPVTAGQAALPGTYKGKLYASDTDRAVRESKVVFKVRRGKVRKFRTTGGLSMCISIIGGFDVSFYPLAFSVPSAAIAGNRIDRRYVVREDGEELATNTLRGRFDGRRARGTLAQDGPGSCRADYGWRARRVR